MGLARGVVWTVRFTLRLFGLSLRYIPLLVLYPISLISSRVHALWWRAMMWTVSRSGPTIIKLGQWASTRRDLFSKNFCDKMSALHTRTKQRRLARGDRILDEVFGASVGRALFRHIDPVPIGSGCVAQVYKAIINVPEFERVMDVRIPQLAGRTDVKVAIKIANRGILDAIALDLSILRLGARILQVLVPGMLFVNPVGCLEQFERVLTRQVDLTHEAKALQRFGHNFDAAKTGIRFPVVLRYSKNVIVETFEEGESIDYLIQGKLNTLMAPQLQSIRERVALMGARALLKMIFVDNFVHGDLHPGNIFVRFNDVSDDPLVHRMPPPAGRLQRMMETVRYWFGWFSTAEVHFTDDARCVDEPSLVVLDTGIAIEQTPANLKNLRCLFWLIVEKRGYEAAELMLSQSPEQYCDDPDTFCNEVAVLIDKARTENASLRKMFSLVSKHKVSLEPAFTSVVMAVMLLEGLGRSLDPELDLFKCARPFLLNVLNPQDYWVASGKTF